MPFIRLEHQAVTTIQPPQSSNPARDRLVRGARRVNHSPRSARPARPAAARKSRCPSLAEHPGETRIATEHATTRSATGPPAWPPAGTGSPGRVSVAAEHPAQAVVPEREFEQAVVGRPPMYGRDCAGHRLPPVPRTTRPTP